MYIFGEEEAQAARRVIMSRNTFRYLEGASETEGLEREICRKFGSRYAIVMNSGTSALMSALAALGIGPGDEVVVPGYTFMATATAVVAVGAIPVIAEIDETLTLDADDLRKKITGRTRAAIPVHIRGLPCNMERIVQVGREAGIAVVEDACQADGGQYRGRRLGTIGDIGAFSFNHFKIMTAGEGGALITDDTSLHDRAFVFHDSGISFRPYSRELTTPVFLGMNFRANEITSAILRVQLERLDGMLAAMRRRKYAHIEALSGLHGIVAAPSNDAEGDCGTTVALLCETAEIGCTLVAELRSEGIDAMRLIDSERHVYSNWDAVMEHRGAHHPARDAFRLPENRDSMMNYTADMCPRTLDILSRTVAVPTHPEQDEATIERTSAGIRKAAERALARASAGSAAR